MKNLIFAAALWAVAPVLPAAMAQTPNHDAPAGPAPDTANPAPSGPGTANSPNGANPVPPLKPGGVRIITQAPEPEKWDGQKSANGMERLFKCKALACSDSETVAIGFSRSPTRHPDPQALDKLAKVDLPKSIRAAHAAHEAPTNGVDNVDTLSSKSAVLKAYPAVINESKFTRAELVTYIDTALIFAGPVMIRVESASQNRDLAQKSLNDFVEVMKIEEGPPPPPGTQEPGDLPATSGKAEPL
jgi:hypothetical protein